MNFELHSSCQQDPGRDDRYNAAKDINSLKSTASRGDNYSNEKMILELTKTIKSVNYQTDEACLKFKENTEN